MVAVGKTAWGGVRFFGLKKPLEWILFQKKFLLRNLYSVQYCAMKRKYQFLNDVKIKFFEINESNYNISPRWLN